MNEEAEKARLAGDEERSYVLYMKYMSMVTKMEKTPDFKKDKTLIVKTLGGNTNISKIFSHLEQLKQSLIERYDQLKEKEQQAASMESINMNVDVDPTLSESRIEVKEVIDCRTLYDMMEENQKLLIMDCRSAEDYEQSKMTYTYTMNIPENILKLGMTAPRILKSLPNESTVFWMLRDQRQLIFVDWYSKRFNRNSPVWHLREILKEWDQETDKKPEILLLSGGYDEWRTVYPMKCYNPQYSPPKSFNGDVAGVDCIEYPNWEDIQMKDTSLNTSIPHIDRTMKPSSAKASEVMKTKLELYQEKEQIVDKSLRNEKELLTVETNYKTIISDKENNEDSTAQEQQYLFRLWELQSKEKDIQVEENSIKELLDQSKDVVEEPLQMTKLAQVEQNLKEKEQERKRIHEERERKKKEREEALKFARDRKPQLNDHRSPPKTQRKNEIILSAKELPNQVSSETIPAFDRSSKPVHYMTRQIFNDQDFFPVYGRVVSLLFFSK